MHPVPRIHNHRSRDLGWVSSGPWFFKQWVRTYCLENLGLQDTKLPHGKCVKTSLPLPPAAAIAKFDGLVTGTRLAAVCPRFGSTLV